MEQMIEGIPVTMRQWIMREEIRGPTHIAELMQRYIMSERMEEYGRIPQPSLRPIQFGSPRRTTATTREQLIKEQQKDLDIQTWKAKEDTEAVDIKNGVLCRLWKPKNKLGKADIQIVVPEMYRRDILKMAHDMPMAGHMGVERTLQRIRKRFWWPGVAKDVKNYVQSCPECQKVAKRPMKVPLMMMPIISKPFE